MKRRVLARLLVTVLVVFALSAGDVAALAAEPVAQGWWTATDPGGLPAAPPADPDVPTDGLLVQGGPTSPRALAALAYTLLAGETATTLTLKVAPSTVTTPSAPLVLCPLKAPTFQPVQGGPIADAPAYDCANQVAAKLDTAGTAYAADVGSLVTNGSLAVALLAGDATSRIVLSKPDDSALATSGASTTSSGFPPVSAPSSGSASSGSVGTGSAESPPLASGAQAPPVDAAVQPPAVAALAPQAADQATALNNQAATPVASESSGNASHRSRLLLLIGCLCVAGVLWSFSGAAASTPLASGDLVDRTASSAARAGADVPVTP